MTGRWTLCRLGAAALAVCVALATVAEAQSAKPKARTTAKASTGMAMTARPDLDPRVAHEAWVVISKIEYREGIPVGLLHAMSLVETGKGQEGKYLLPWPYTVNVNGGLAKDYPSSAEALAQLDKLRALGFDRFDVTVDRVARAGLTGAAAENFLTGMEGAKYTLRARPYAKSFQSKDQGSAFVQGLLDKGYENIDIGLMQVNWKYHGKEFESVADAFDPYKNVSYAVAYLREHRKTRDWWGSVGRYHSATGELAKRYVTNVWGMYQRVHRLKPSST